MKILMFHWAVGSFWFRDYNYEDIDVPLGLWKFLV